MRENAPVILSLFISLAASQPPSPSAESRILPSLPWPGSQAIEPFPYLQGGAFTAPPIPFHPDPLARYAWAPSTNASQLQVFALLPATVTLTPDTPPGSFANASTLLAPAPLVTVAGPGGLQLDFGLNSAAWVEFDSPDLQPEDAALVTLGISEYNEYEVTNLGDKVARPTPHPVGANTTTWRLEIPHSDGSGLFEGVRFAWLRVNATPGAPWHITGLRLMCQVKPTNWRGAFAAAGDDALSRIWYLGAYTVKVNLLADQFGTILIYRGDRFSWGGDAHVAQATSMAALGNFPFVAQNLIFTRNNCNGIESYCLYLVLSATDYFAATADAALMAELNSTVAPKLEHAHDVWGQKVKLAFTGWE